MSHFLIVSMINNNGGLVVTRNLIREKRGISRDTIFYIYFMVDLEINLATM
jgi:hypothetical protein